MLFRAFPPETRTLPGAQPVLTVLLRWRLTARRVSTDSTACSLPVFSVPGSALRGPDVTNRRTAHLTIH